MIKVKNVFTEREYEALQYNNNYQEVKDFIQSTLDISVTRIQPNIRVYKLNSYTNITNIKPMDWIIRHKGIYKSISNEIINSNFSFLNDSNRIAI